MGPGTITRYSASAGSGKTFELTLRYLTCLFNSGSSYKRILAVTFTNKAATEMKMKILEQLFLLSKGEVTNMTERLAGETGLTPEMLKEKSAGILRSILHDYYFFNVGTIDSFFQKILRVFAREINLQHGYLIEIEPDHILDTAVDKTLNSVATDQKLMNWITKYTSERIEDGKSVNIKADILSLSDEIFKEKFRLLSPEEKSNIRDREYLDSYVDDLKRLISSFRSELKRRCDECRAILNENGVSDEMFYKGKSGGAGSFMSGIEKGNKGIYKALNQTVSKVRENPPVWTAKGGMTARLQKALSDGFADLFTGLLDYYEENYLRVNTAILIQENIYKLGILSDILHNVREVTSNENRFLLSDAGEFLFRLINGEQTPFIYEKTGNRYENYMIDEFQDTSVIQWNNFLPLIKEGMAGGHDSLVVGDVKQSIYRWRNSDWKILGSDIVQQFGERLQTIPLDTNWRSLRNIIAFNNTLFSVLPEILQENEEMKSSGLSLPDIYSGVKQSCPEGKEGGLVELEFIKNGDAGFHETALGKIVPLIEKIQDLGYRASDIGILVRTNSEGAEIIEKILSYRENAQEEKSGRYNYSVVSGDSLFLNSSPAVSFLIAFLKYIQDTSRKIYLALMLQNWWLATSAQSVNPDLSDVINTAGRVWPPDWEKFISGASDMALFDATESAIKYFGLGNSEENNPFLSAFQDCILEYSVNYSPGISGFLEWWEIYGPGKTLPLSDRQDSIKVMTIHKSKGLEFPVVIIPFLDWPAGHGRKNPVFWVKPVHEPFNRLSVIPLKFKSDLRLSLFKKDYDNEFCLALIDTLNLLYVAFTRAREALFVFCDGDPESNTVSDLIMQGLNSRKTETDDKKPVINLNEYFNAEKGIFSLGSPEAGRSERNISETSTVRTEKYLVTGNLSTMRLKLRGSGRYVNDKVTGRPKVNYGRIMHEILAAAATADDIPGVLEEALRDGRISSSEKDTLYDKISKTLQNPVVMEWFKPGNRVLTETGILIPGSGGRRPDRVIIQGDRAVVVDFKSGEERKKDYEQVRYYMKLLREMGFAKVEGNLWYISEERIINVE